MPQDQGYDLVLLVAEADDLRRVDDLVTGKPRPAHVHKAAAVVQDSRHMDQQTVALREALGLPDGVKDLQRVLHGVDAVGIEGTVTGSDLLRRGDDVRIEVVLRLHQLPGEGVLRRDAVDQDGPGHPDLLRSELSGHPAVDCRGGHENAGVLDADAEQVLQLRIVFVDDVGIALFQGPAGNDPLLLGILPLFPHEAVKKDTDRLAHGDQVPDLPALQVETAVDLQFMIHQLGEQPFPSVPGRGQLVHLVPEPQRPDPQVLGADHLPFVKEGDLHAAEGQVHDGGSFFDELIEFSAAGGCQGLVA